MLGMVFGEVAGEGEDGQVLLLFGCLLGERADDVGGQFGRMDAFEFGLDEVIAMGAAACGGHHQAVQQCVLRLQGVAALVGGEIDGGVVLGVGVGSEQGESRVNLAVLEVFVCFCQGAGEGLLFFEAHTGDVGFFEQFEFGRDEVWFAFVGHGGGVGFGGTQEARRGIGIAELRLLFVGSRGFFGGGNVAQAGAAQ